MDVCYCLASRMFLEVTPTSELNPPRMGKGGGVEGGFGGGVRLTGIPNIPHLVKERASLLKLVPRR